MNYGDRTMVESQAALRAAVATMPSASQIVRVNEEMRAAVRAATATPVGLDLGRMSEDARVAVRAATAVPNAAQLLASLRSDSPDMLRAAAIMPKAFEFAALVADKYLTALGAPTPSAPVRPVQSRPTHPRKDVPGTTVESLAERLVMRGLDVAAAYLQSAHEFADVESDDREFPLIIHRAVGALEELACHLTFGRSKTLDDALQRLTKRGRITSAEAVAIRQAYILRHQIRGAGHGARRCPEHVMRYVLLLVRKGVGLLLDRSDVT